MMLKVRLVHMILSLLGQIVLEPVFDSLKFRMVDNPRGCIGQIRIDHPIHMLFVFNRCGQCLLIVTYLT